MKRRIIKKIWIFITLSVFTIFLLPNIINAQWEDDIQVDGFNIIPELESGEVEEVQQKIIEIWQTWWNVWDKYNETAASTWFTTAKQLSSWIMNRDTILNYLTFIIKFLSQLWLLVWTIFIMIAWYKYIVSLFQGQKVPSESVKNAIIWIIIVIFSYAIMRILTSFVGLN